LPDCTLFWDGPFRGENGAMQPRLLVVEDDETIRETIRDSLELE
jgi:hypothetical protein